MKTDTFLTLQAQAEGLYKEKGSKFIALAFPVTSEDAVKERLTEIKKQYYDARHHCYAYVLGRDQTSFRANDDGEPNNSAGMPILGQIRSKNLTNTLVVVVRYFGGTKLGVSGLINAYKIAAAEALEAATIIEEIVKETLQVQFEYPQMNDVMRIGKEYELDMSEQTFDERCQIRFAVREQHLTAVLAKLEKIEGLEVQH